MTHTASPRRVRITLPPKDDWPRTRRGVASEIRCGTCGERCRGKDHAAARAALRAHRLEKHV